MNEVSLPLRGFHNLVGRTCRVCGKVFYVSLAKRKTRRHVMARPKNAVTCCNKCSLKWGVLRTKKNSEGLLGCKKNL